MLKAVMFFGAIVLIGGLVIGSVLLGPVIDLPPAPIDHNDTVIPVVPIVDLRNYTAILLNVVENDYCVAVFENRNISFGKMFVSETYDALISHIGQEIIVFYEETIKGVKFMGLEVINYTPSIEPPVNEPNESYGEYTFTGRLDWVAWPGPKYEGQPGPDYCLVVFNMMNRTYYGDGEAYWEGTNISFCDRWASEACSNLQGYVGQYITLIYNVTEEGIRFGGVR